MDTVLIIFANATPNEADTLEFKELVKACDFTIETCFYQMLKSIQLTTYIGKGKCQEIKEYLEEHPCSYVIFNQELSPLQIKNLELLFQIPVYDRTDLILAIFQQRAKTPTARLQIESAQLKKMLPRLIGSNTSLGRQSASGKNKGTGEKQLELDRRNIKQRITEVDRELKRLESQRFTQRRSRQQSSLPMFSLVGYTNAGKSTIMNQLLRYSNHQEDKQVLEKNMLFATLDTSVRHIQLPYGQSFLLSDTVGFVNHLPHELIQAFHSTLEEVKYADVLLQVVDASDPEHLRHMEVTQDTLQVIEAAAIPIITIFNKCDLSEYDYPNRVGDRIYISAKQDDNITYLLEQILDITSPKYYLVQMEIPYNQGAIYSKIMESCKIEKQEYTEFGISLIARLTEPLFQKYRDYVTKMLSNEQ